MDREKIIEDIEEGILMARATSTKIVHLYVDKAEEIVELLKEQDELLKHEYWRGYNNGRADERGLQEGTIMQTFSPD